MALVLTLSSPSLKLALSRMARGKRPSVGSLESCASTFGLLGAELSGRTSHLGAPPAWVIVDVQPGGSAPIGSESKLKISAPAWLVKPASKSAPVVITPKVVAFITLSFASHIVSVRILYRSEPEN